MSRPRPFFVTITTIGVFLLGMWNAWRVWILAQQGSLLIELGATLNPYVRLAMALVWSGLFLMLAVALWKHRPVVRRLLPLSLLLYALYRLSLLIFFVRAPAARQGWQIDMVLHIVAIAWTTWVMYRPAYHDYWQLSERNSMITDNDSKVIQRGNDGESKD